MEEISLSDEYVKNLLSCTRKTKIEMEKPDGSFKLHAIISVGSYLKRSIQFHLTILEAMRDKGEMTFH
jgi:hypothetical protein